MTNTQSSIAGRPEPKRGKAAPIWCALFAGLWLVLYMWSKWPGSGGASIAAGLQAVTLILFVAAHASVSNGWRGFLAFFGVVITSSFVLEASSIATGFPFGLFTHNVAGPKLLGVPPHVPISYAVLGWLAWTLARLIVREHPNNSFGLNRFSTPIVATFILAGYDFAFDPIGATVLKLWTYHRPSGDFGVPLSNLLGWLFTGWLFFQLFALIEHRFPPKYPATLTLGYWLLPCLIWGASALQYPFEFAIAPSGMATVAGRSFVVADIYEAGLMTALMTTVFAAVTATLRLCANPALSTKQHRSEQEH